ncbi:MAG: hypothetical protein QXS37_04195 [Candidatus Aenigmatarchaeota archaeon]
MNLTNITTLVDIVKFTGEQTNDLLPSLLVGALIIIVYINLFRRYQKPLTCGFLSLLMIFPVALIFQAMNLFAGDIVLSYIFFTFMIGGLAYYFEK